MGLSVELHKRYGLDSKTGKKAKGKLNKNAIIITCISGATCKEVACSMKERWSPFAGRRCENSDPRSDDIFFSRLFRLPLIHFYAPFIIFVSSIKLLNYAVTPGIS